jgi:hypothetical protein
MVTAQGRGLAGQTDLLRPCTDRRLLSKERIRPAFARPDDPEAAFTSWVQAGISVVALRPKPVSSPPFC